MEPIEWAIFGGVLLAGAGVGTGVVLVGNGISNAETAIGTGIGQGAANAENTVAKGTAVLLGLAGVAIIVWAYGKSKGR